MHREPRRRRRGPCPDGSGCACLPKLTQNRLRYRHSAEQLRQDVDLADQHKIAKRPSVRDDEAHGSNTQALQRFHVALYVFQRIRLKYPALLQKGIQIEARGDT